MEQFLGATLDTVLLKLLGLSLAAMPIAVLNAIVVQVAKWAGFAQNWGTFRVRQLSLAHSLLLAALWGTMSFYPAATPYVEIAVVAFYSGLLAAILYEVVWTRVAKFLDIPASVQEFDKEKNPQNYPQEPVQFQVGSGEE